uniref:RNase H type-1 domain-containing protein n=1 Tax=Cannabis sativa TaxID=3483 RepID=A0A803Q9K5_CANSA
MDKVEFENFICLLWSIWNDRNSVLHGGANRVASVLVSQAQIYIDKYRLAKAKGRERSHTPDQVVPNQLLPQSLRPNQQSNSQQGATNQQFSRPRPDIPQQLQHNSINNAAGPTAIAANGIPWKPPDVNCLKMNVDAAVNAMDKVLGIGAVVRNCKGEVVAALSKSIQGHFRSDEMEAKALFHSLNWAFQQQIPISQVETDALRVSSALATSRKDLSCFSDLIDDVRCLLSFFPRVTVTHIRRHANQAAHCYSKYALELMKMSFDGRNTSSYFFYYCK